MRVVAAVGKAGGGIGVGDVAAGFHAVWKLGAEQLGCASESAVDYADFHGVAVEARVVPGEGVVGVRSFADYLLLRGYLRSVGRDYDAHAQGGRKVGESLEYVDGHERLHLLVVCVAWADAVLRQKRYDGGCV